LIMVIGIDWLIFAQNS